MSLPIQPVIMAGGSGTRLWPLSRAGYPKQFLVLSGNSSLFQQAACRLQGLAGDGVDLAAPLVVGNEEHRFLILDQLREARLTPAAVLLEPCGRNTAPALTLAALQALEGGTDPVLVVTPADQTATDEVAFAKALAEAARQAAGGGITILGVRPARPETGYGYIRAKRDGTGAEFVEKPDLATAEAYLADRRLDACRAAIAEAVRAAGAGRGGDDRFVRPAEEGFAAVPSESVDYAVMERCPGSNVPIRMVELAAGWNDLGSWEAVWQVARRDAEGNAQVGDAIVVDSRNTMVHATSRLVSVVGLEDVIVVETADAVLVADRERSQEVKQIVNRLGAEQRGEQALHRKVHRPWGWYDSIDAGDRFQVKRIMVKPGATLSLQKHHHRAEHWIVVRGTAEVTNGDQVMLLSENQSTYIPLGTVHRLANPGKVPLEIIEVQSGSYLGEDDIVRFEDTYGRAGKA